MDTLEGAQIVQAAAWELIRAAGTSDSFPLALRWLATNIAGLGIGYQESSLFHLRFYLEAPVTDEVLEYTRTVPEWAGAQFSVTGPFLPIPPRTGLGKMAPAVPASTCVGLHSGAGQQGTLCAFITAGGSTCLLSCRHVLDVDPTLGGDLGVIESTTDGSRLIGTVVESTPNWSDATAIQDGDWAVAEVRGVPVNPILPGNLGVLDTTPAVVANGITVVKAAQSQQLEGTVVDTNAFIVIKNYRDHVIRSFKKHLLVQGQKPGGGFASNGDSGTLLVDTSVQPKAAGMIFARNVLPPQYLGLPESIRLTAAFPLYDFLSTRPLKTTQDPLTLRGQD